MRAKPAWALCSLLVLLTSGCTWISRISVNSAGVQANDESGASGSSPGPSAISPDGRYLAFESAASNLVPGDTNDQHDVFVRDAVARTTSRVSVGNTGSQANADSAEPAISDDARYVAFESDASNLVAGDGNGVRDVFVRDTVGGTTVRASVSGLGVQGNGFSFNPVISADGRYVAFYSNASNLVAGDTNGSSDVFVRDIVAGTTSRVSVGNGGTQAATSEGSEQPAMSPDGRYVAFDSAASNLVSGDTNGTFDVFVRDTVAGTTTRVSVSTSETDPNETSGQAQISADGRFVAFSSLASNLVAGDTNNRVDVFVRDLVSGTTSRVARNSSDASISADGRYVAFDSLDQGDVHDTNDVDDVYVHDGVAGTISRLSTSFVGAQGDGASRYPSISGDGRFVAFASEATNLVDGSDTNGSDVYVKANPEPAVSSVAPSSLTHGTTTPVTVTGSHFLDGARLVVDGGGASVANVVVVNEHQITADVTVAAGATLGARNVFVELPGTGPAPSVAAVGVCGACVTVN